ncbi:hypothetical protein NL676_000716 [Syzygium grande]|nr:hypothetical protein NL676_000716 [Syzygium grande]
MPLLAAGEAAMALGEDSFKSDAKIQPPSEGDVEMGSRMPWSNSDMELEAFKSQIQEVEKQLNNLSSLLKKLKFHLACNESEMSNFSGINQQMEIDVHEVGKIARNAKAKLEAINKENLANQKKPGYEKGTVVDRSRMSMTNALTKKFEELMTEFQTLDKRFGLSIARFLREGVITVTGTRPDEETINRLIESGDGEQIFQKALEEMRRGQIYLDMAVPVEAQGEILDNIDGQYQSTMMDVYLEVDCAPQNMINK